MSTTTQVKTISDAFTEARARYVLGKIFDTFNNIIFRGFTTISADNLKQWRGDIQYIMEKNALIDFEIQFRTSEKKWALRYEVASGTVSRDDESGGIDFYNIPADALLSCVIKRDNNNKDVNEYIERRGFGKNGEFIAESASIYKSHSKDGFGVNLKILGEI